MKLSTPSNIAVKIKDEPRPMLVRRKLITSDLQVQSLSNTEEIKKERGKEQRADVSSKTLKSY